MGEVAARVACVDLSCPAQRPCFQCITMWYLINNIPYFFGIEEKHPTLRTNNSYIRLAHCGRKGAWPCSWESQRADQWLQRTAHFEQKYCLCVLHCQDHKSASYLQVHVMIEHCLLMRLDAIQTEHALVFQGVPRCMTRIGNNMMCISDYISCR